MGSLLGSLQLQPTPLLFEVSLDAVVLLPQPLGVPILGFLPIELLLGLKALILLLEPILYFLLDGLLACDRLLLHAPLHLVKLAGQFFLLAHDLLVVAVLIEPCLVAKLFFHLVCEQFEPLLLLKSLLLFEQVLVLVARGDDGGHVDIVEGGEQRGVVLRFLQTAGNGLAQAGHLHPFFAGGLTGGDRCTWCGCWCRSSGGRDRDRRGCCSKSVLHVFFHDAAIAACAGDLIG